MADGARYSSLRTTFGSRREARQAGSQQATAAITTFDGIAMTSVTGWELERGEDSVAIAVSGSLLLDDEDLVLQAARDGAGLAIVDGERAVAHVKSGRLVEVMRDWMAPFHGFFLYSPHRKQQPAALTAVIDLFRLQR
jgi:DNA-binding transcriptional LysR family regulator